MDEEQVALLGKYFEDDEKDKKKKPDTKEIIVVLDVNNINQGYLTN